MTDRFVEINGLRTRYIQKGGSGRPLIFLHGIGMSSDCFQHTMDSLANEFSVYALDLIGHGFTEYAGFAGENPLVQLSDHVSAFASALGLTPAIVAGSSLGGGIAAQCAIDNPAVVRALVIVGSATPFATAQKLASGLSAAKANAREAFENPSRENLRQRLANLVVNQAAVDDGFVRAQERIYAQPDRWQAYSDLVDSCVYAAENGIEITAFSELHRITAPVLIIAGEDDPRSPLDTIREGSKRIRDARFQIYSDCGHFPFLEHPNRFYEDVVTFTKQVS